MKSSRSLRKTLAKVIAICGSCFTAVPAFCCQNIVSASTVYSQEAIYNARLVFTSDVYSKINNYVSNHKGSWPSSIGTEQNGRTYLYFNENPNMKIKLDENQLQALEVLKDAFGLGHIMHVIMDPNTYIVTDGSNYNRTSNGAPVFVQSSNQYSNFRVSFNHKDARKKDVSSVLGFPSKFLNSRNIKNFDNLFNYIQDRAMEFINNKAKLESKNLSRYKKALQSINGSVYGSVSSSLPNFDYYVFAWGETLEKLEYEWDAVYEAYGKLNGVSDNLYVCYKNKYNSYESVPNIDYNRDKGGLGVGTFKNYGYPPVREVTNTLLSFVNC